VAEAAGPIPPRATGAIGTPAECSIVVSTASRCVRRKLRPLAWLVLEEVALTAVEDGGRLVAHTSARQVADQVGVDPGTAASALRVLRDRGLLRLEREKGRAGRFGLSVYVLGSIAGLTVVKPSDAERHLALPSLDKTDVAKPYAVVARAEKPCADAAYGMAPATALAHMASERAGQGSRRPPRQAVAPAPADCSRTCAPSAAPAMQTPGQGTLDLDWGVA
jgi:DNA-binding transcriptional ArsR family regulator